MLGSGKIVSVISVAVDGATLDPSAYMVMQTAGFVRPKEPINGEQIVVTYTAGYSTVPPDVKQAIVEMVKISRDAAATNSSVRSEQADGVGQTVYSDVADRGELPASVRAVIARYRVRFIV